MTQYYEPCEVLEETHSSVLLPSLGWRSKSDVIKLKHDQKDLTAEANCVKKKMEQGNVWFDMSTNNFERVASDDLRCNEGSIQCMPTTNKSSTKSPHFVEEDEIDYRNSVQSTTHGAQAPNVEPNDSSTSLSTEDAQPNVFYGTVTRSGRASCFPNCYRDYIMY